MSLEEVINSVQYQIEQSEVKQQACDKNSYTLGYLWHAGRLDGLKQVLVELKNFSTYLIDNEIAKR